MRLFLSLALGLFAGISVFATNFRSDVIATAEIKLAQVPGDNMNSRVQGWLKTEVQPKTLTADASEASNSEWRTCKYSFVATANSSCTINFMANWSRTPEGKKWMKITNIKINGELINNGDLKQLNDNNPSGFSMTGKPRFEANAGPNNEGVAIVNHDNRISAKIDLEAGKTYTVEVQAMAE